MPGVALGHRRRSAAAAGSSSLGGARLDALDAPRRAHRRRRCAERSCAAALPPATVAVRRERRAAAELRAAARNAPARAAAALGAERSTAPRSARSCTLRGRLRSLDAIAVDDRRRDVPGRGLAAPAPAGGRAAGRRRRADRPVVAAGWRACSTASGRGPSTASRRAWRPTVRRCCAGWCWARTRRSPSRQRDEFRAAGLAHILAVSGQNVMLLAALALPAADGGRRRRSRPRARAARPDRALRAARGRRAVAAARGHHGRGRHRRACSPRVRRRAGTPCCWRRSSRWPSIPRACGDPGWQLSFAAVAGILLLGRPLARPPEGAACARSGRVLRAAAARGWRLDERWSARAAVARSRRRSRAHRRRHARDRAAAGASLRHRLAGLAAGERARAAARRAGDVAGDAQGARPVSCRRSACRATCWPPALGADRDAPAGRHRRCSPSASPQLPGAELPLRSVRPLAVVAAYVLPAAAWLGDPHRLTREARRSSRARRGRPVRAGAGSRRRGGRCSLRRRPSWPCSGSRRCSRRRSRRVR